MPRKLMQMIALFTMLMLLAACGQAADVAPGSPSPSPDDTAAEASPESQPSPEDADDAITSPEASLTDMEASPVQEASPEATSATGGEPVNVVATTTIIADLVENVGGERVDVRSIIPSGSDPHTYQPTPSDVQAVAESQIMFQNGLGLEEWIEEVLANAGGERPVVTVTEGITPLEGDDAHGDEHADEHADEATPETEHGDDAHADDHGDEHAGEATAEADDHGHAEDPHMWFDVQLTIRYVENIRDGLIELDPDNQELYESNAAAYLEQLEQLDQEIAEQLETIPQENRKIITNHDTFAYFAERYGFEVVGTVFQGVSPEQEPSAQQIATLVRAIQEQNVPAVFTETTVNPRLAEQVADEAGVQVVTTLYTDALGEPGSPGDSYIGMMRHNVEQIVEALQ